VLTKERIKDHPSHYSLCNTQQKRKETHPGGSPYWVWRSVRTNHSGVGIWIIFVVSFISMSRDVNNNNFLIVMNESELKNEFRPHHHFHDQIKVLFCFALLEALI
jgi:hypothetical protein